MEGKETTIAHSKAPLSYFLSLQLDVKRRCGIVSIFHGSAVLSAIFSDVLPPWGFKRPENCLQLKKAGGKEGGPLLSLLI